MGSTRVTDGLKACVEAVGKGVVVGSAARLATLTILTTLASIATLTVLTIFSVLTTLASARTTTVAGVEVQRDARRILVRELFTAHDELFFITFI